MPIPSGAVQSIHSGQRGSTTEDGIRCGDKDPGGMSREPLPIDGYKTHPGSGLNCCEAEHCSAGLGRNLAFDRIKQPRFPCCCLNVRKDLLEARALNQDIFVAHLGRASHGSVDFCVALRAFRRNAVAPFALHVARRGDCLEDFPLNWV